MRPKIAQRWQQQLAWLDGWFGLEKADRHAFDPAERELFEALSRTWLAAEDKIGALEATSARFGRDRVRAMIDRLCADETSAYWGQLAMSEGRSLDDLVRLLWEPLPAQGFEFEMERVPDGLRIRCTRCPIADLADEVRAGGSTGGGPDAHEWLYAMVCSTDFHVTAAFDPPIRFERKKTLMQGNDCCDHAYLVERLEPHRGDQRQ